MITAVTAVGALVFTGLSLNATREQTALSEQGQITDRYGKAVEQVGRQGPENLQIRLGGIFALERLAHDSPRDQPTIIEVLSAFVRVSTTPAFGEPCPEDPSIHGPTADVQAALTALGRRNPNQDGNARVDLRKACLSFAELGSTHLAGAELGDTHLVGAELSGADLSDANLEFANVGVARLQRADLQRARLFRADLHAADLRDARLDGADLSNTDLQNAFVSGAVLVNADLNGAVLTKAFLNGANLRSANLNNAFLEGTDLRGAEHDEHTQTNGTNTDDKTSGKWW